MTASQRALTLALVSPLPLILLTTLAATTLAYQSEPPAEEAAASEFRRWLEFKEFQEFQQWKRLRRSRRADDLIDQQQQQDGLAEFVRRSSGDGPPPVDQPARMARYIVNQAGWTSVATVGSRKDTESYPFVNIISFSDGPLGNGTGIPYLYLTPLDFTAQDVFKDNRATLMMTLAQGRYCESKNYDPMDPRCARVVFSGKIKAVKEGNDEYPIAKNAVFGRHPWLAHMPKDHHFFFAKLKIGTIAVLDTFGGPKYVTLQDYLHPPADNVFSDY